MKHLYVRPAYRGLGLGEHLVTAVIGAATTAGYDELRLDTLSSMESAQALYKRLGFREIAPYGDKHLPGMCFFSRSLTPQCRELHLHPNGARWLGVVYAGSGKLGETAAMRSMEAARAKATKQFGASEKEFVWSQDGGTILSEE